MGYTIQLQTASSALLRQLAAEQRRVLADWRALILLRRATFELPPSERRWSQLPHAPADMHPVLRQMERRGELTSIRGIRNVFEVTVPYARTGHIAEDEVLLEVHPYATLSFLSALAFHGLTDELPKGIVAMVSVDGTGDLLPLGTEPRDWEGIPLVRGRMVDRVLGRPVTWRQVKPEWFFGLGVYQPRGYPVRVTTPERTLLDSIQAPELSGGIENVLRAWARARDTLDIDKLVYNVDRFDIAILRQRAGFMLEELALSHPRLREWQGMARRGGSSKLVGSTSYAPQFSERWSLSLNAPLAALHDGAS